MLIFSYYKKDVKHVFFSFVTSFSFCFYLVHVDEVHAQVFMYVGEEGPFFPFFFSFSLLCLSLRVSVVIFLKYDLE